MDRLFLGIADTNNCAFMVVGDSSGEILFAGIGGSVNHRCWGINQAKLNLHSMIEAVGAEIRSRIAGVCFTYIKEHQITQEEVLPVVSGLVEEAAVHVEDLATTGALGLHSPKERLFLMGDRLGLAILLSEGGQRHEVRQGELLWNSRRDHEDFSHIQELHENEQCLSDLAQALDCLASQGSPWALGVAYDIACDLVRLVVRLGNRFSRPDPVIGFCGPLLLGSETIRQRVQYLLSLLFPQAEVISAPLAPAKGAYLSSLLTRNTELRPEVLTTFYNSARNVTQRGWLDFVINISKSAERNCCQVV